MDCHNPCHTLGMTPPTEFASRMRSQREAAGFSLSEATFELRSVLPKALWCSLETIRRMENGRTTEAKADPVLVTALADVYGCKVRDLSPSIAEGLEGLRDLLSRSSACTTGADRNLYQTLADTLCSG